MRYEFRDDELFDNDTGSFAMWRTVSGRIGMGDHFKAKLYALLNPCWGAADEYEAAKREDMLDMLREAKGLIADVLSAKVGPGCWQDRRDDWLARLAKLEGGDASEK